MATKAKSTNVWPVIEDVIHSLEAGECLGWCLDCGAERWEVEPDAERYECEECGKRRVMGAENILLAHPNQ